MPLSSERSGQIAMAFLQQKMEEDGVRLNPNTVKRQIMDDSKRLGVSPQEMAEFVGVVIHTAYQRTMSELNKIKNSSSAAV